MEQKELLSIILVGDATVGKTCIIKRYAEDTFAQNFSTIGIEYTQKEVTVNDKHYIIRLIDTAGQEKYRSVVKNYFKNADGVVLVYDAANKDSFNHVSEWLCEINENCDPSIPIMIIGNKIDLVDKEIKYNQGQMKAEESNALFYEGSAKSGSNIDDAFEAVIQKVIQFKAHRELEEKKNESRELVDIPPPSKKCNCA